MYANVGICLLSTSSVKHSQKKEQILAGRLGLPLCADEENNYRYHLVYTDNRLELQQNPHLCHNKENPLYVDFLHGERVHRRISTLSNKNPLARAAGIKPGIRPCVADATAGLGMDGISLAWLGCMVIFIERNPIIHALLKDGLERAKMNHRMDDIIEESVTLHQGNAMEILSKIFPAPDTVLVDPMYPKTLKGPLNKKEMRILRQLAGDDSDGHELFKYSLQNARNRVVVKRPKGAQNLCNSPPPSFSVPMKSGRFDVYLKNHL